MPTAKESAELVSANQTLLLQNEEKEKRAAELAIANKELAFQNEEKEKRAAELAIANKELLFQNEEKENRAEELRIANKELLAFNYISSHDLQEPLRKIQMFTTVMLENEAQNLSDKGRHYLDRIQFSAARMQQLIEDLLAFSRISTSDHKFVAIDLNIIVAEVIDELKDSILEKNAMVEIPELCHANIIAFQFRQLMENLICNALKFARPGILPHIIVSSKVVTGSESGNPDLHAEKNYCHITVQDNGIGFDPEFKDRIFELFQKLHGNEHYDGTGIGLAIVKKIVDNHKGHITATGALNKGARFDIYLPA